MLNSEKLAAKVPCPKCQAEVFLRQRVCPKCGAQIRPMGVARKVLALGLVAVMLAGVVAALVKGPAP